MPTSESRRRPGQVRDAIVEVLERTPDGASLGEIQTGVSSIIGPTSPSSIRSYLNLNAESLFHRTMRGRYTLRGASTRGGQKKREFRSVAIGGATLVLADCIEWLNQQPENSIHATVTDPPYGLVEYEPEQQEKRRNGRGGVWRIPPSFDGAK